MIDTTFYTSRKFTSLIPKMLFPQTYRSLNVMLFSPLYCNIVCSNLPKIKTFLICTGQIKIGHRSSNILTHIRTDGNTFFGTEEELK